MPFAIFASYSTGGNVRLRKKIHRFCDKLTDRVQSKSGRSIADCKIFFDAESIRFGGKWRDELAEAACRSEALLCLVSPHYLQSDWCGQEFAVFRHRCDLWERKANKNLAVASFIFPVSWESTTGYLLPPDLAAFQNQIGVATDRYPDAGLCEILNRRLTRDYTKLLEVLSDRIRDLLLFPGELPPHPGFGSWDEILNGLEIWRPYDFRWISAKAPTSTWDKTGLGLSLELVVQQVGGNLGCGGRRLAGGNALPSNLQLLRDRKLITIVIVEANQGLGNADLVQIDATPTGLLALVIVDPQLIPGSQPMSPEQWMAVQFPKGSFAQAVADGRAVSTSLPEFTANLESLVRLTRSKCMATEVLPRVTDASIGERARLDGVPVDQKPTLQGPGGSAS